jgi:hypothetical protein
MLKFLIRLRDAYNYVNANRPVPTSIIQGALITITGDYIS